MRKKELKLEVRRYVVVKCYTMLILFSKSRLIPNQSDQVIKATYGVEIRSYKSLFGPDEHGNW